MSYRILAVDDSKANRHVAETTLADAGFEVALAEDGREALEMLRLDGEMEEPSFDAVLLDVMMPAVGGLEVLERIRKRWGPVQLPVIMATAKDEPEDVVAALEKGANDYVAKPLDMTVLLARLNTALQLRDANISLRTAQEALVSGARIESVGLLAAGVAHEIRNPLAAIRMAVGGFQALVPELPEAEQETGRMIADSIEKSVGAADEIVKRLMKFSEKNQLKLESADVNEVIRKGMENLGPELESCAARLEFRLEDELPEVPLAEDEFQQAFGAILRNAVHASVNGGSDPGAVVVRSESTRLDGVGAKEGGRSGNRPRDGDAVVAIHVEDTGPGMSREELESAFDAFFTTKPTGVGTGLGLTVARKIIDLHKGLIRLENRTDVPSGVRASIFLKTGKGLRTHV